jgi:hypothetical protein
MQPDKYSIPNHDIEDEMSSEPQQADVETT